VAPPETGSAARAVGPVFAALCLHLFLSVGIWGDGVDEEMLLHSAEMEVNGELFCINIFCSAAGRFFAKTCLGEGDFIITDAPSLPEAVKRHEDLLPLAVGTRELTQSYLGSPRRLRGRRL